VSLLTKHSHKDPFRLARIFAARGFQRSATAIVVKRKRLGCNTLDPDHYTATALSLEFGVNPSTVASWCEKGWLKARRRGTERQAVQGGDMWWIKVKDVRQFVIDHVGAVDLRKVDKVWFVDLLAK
jgi:hypothetical protein